MDVCDSLLLLSSALLPLAIRTELKLAVARALTCLCKGVLPPLYPQEGLSIRAQHTSFLRQVYSTSGVSVGGSDGSSYSSSSTKQKNKIWRVSAENIRFSPPIQASLLTLGLTEILSSYANGDRSGNVSVLQEVCKACMGGSETHMVAYRVALSLESVLFPSLANVVSASVPKAVHATLVYI
jgi:hypothetical protein